MLVSTVLAAPMRNNDSPPPPPIPLPTFVETFAFIPQGKCLGSGEVGVEGTSGEHGQGAGAAQSERYRRAPRAG